MYLERVGRVVAFHAGLEHCLGLVATAARYRRVDQLYLGVERLVHIEQVVLAVGLAARGPPAEELELAAGVGVALHALGVQIGKRASAPFCSAAAGASTGCISGRGRRGRRGIAATS